MASASRVLLRRFLTGNVRYNSRNVNGVTPSRTAVTSTTGAVLPKPDKTRYGVVRMTVVVAPFLYVGTLISKQFAALLEEHDIFVPDDDDD